jgi:predicted transcriptional regulator
MAEAPAREPNHIGTIAITAHLPKETRDRLKILAVRMGRMMNEMIAEALDDLFALYGQGPDNR